MRDANRILAEGITAEILQWRHLEVMGDFADSPNSKLILSDGNVPTLLSIDPEAK